jgi:DNA repair photolyase
MGRVSWSVPVQEPMLNARWGAMDSLPTALQVSRTGEILHPFAMRCTQGVYALNVSRGCAHRCAYCYARAYRDAPPETEVQVYGNLPTLLREELDSPRRRKALPRVVSLCTATDLFQPLPDLLRVTYEACQILLERRIPIAFLTKGYIPEDFIALFAAHAPLVRARIGLISLDPRTHRLYERGAAHPEARLLSLRRLQEAGIQVGIRHDPVIPGVTDLPWHLEALCARLREQRITTLDVGHLYVRPGIERLLWRELPRAEARRLLAFFVGRPPARVAASNVTRLLPPAVRLESYERIRRIAVRHGIRTYLCACKNPDLKGDRCSGVGEMQEAAGLAEPGRQAELFPEARWRRAPRRRRKPLARSDGMTVQVARGDAPAPIGGLAGSPG